MLELADAYASKFRVVMGGALIVASLFLLNFMISAYRDDNVVFALESSHTSSTGNASSEKIYTNPNAVSTGMGRMADNAVRTVESVESQITGTIKAAASTTAHAGKSAGAAAVKGSRFVARNVYSGLSFAGKTAVKGTVFLGTNLISGIVFTVHLPAKAVVFAASTLSANSFTRPANDSEVPVIDSQLAALYTSNPASPPEEQASLPSAQPELDAIWPIKGRVTTMFGVPHWPYQETHTGLDISSGKYSGVTPVKPFSPGKVLHVVYSDSGLGNHVVVDHGDGITSVYAHLYSISVKKNQLVDKDTPLGLEGSTGVSTGTHLHFEIRVGNKAVDPHEFISNHP